MLTRPRRLVRRAVIGLFSSMVCLLAYLEWRASHHIDLRFVGSWVYVHDSKRSPVYYKYNSDGTGAVYDVARSRTMPVYEFDWSVNNGQLRTRVRESGLASMELLLSDALSMLTRQPRQSGFTTNITALTPLRMQFSGSKNFFERLSQKEIESLDPQW